MKHILHKVCLAVLLFVVGVCSGWADTATLQLSSTTKFSEGGTLKDNQGFSWKENGASAGNYQTQNYGGQQFGTSSTTNTYTFTADFSGYKVTSVSIKANSGNATNTYDISVGGSSWKSGVLTKNTAADGCTTYTATGDATGNVVITLTQKAKNAVYLNNIVVTYTKDDGGDGGDGDTPTPTPSASVGYFVKIASADDIVDGGQYIIVREESSTQYAAGINEGSANYLSINEFATTGYYYGEVNKSGKPYVYTLTADAGNVGYYFLTNGDKYLNAADGKTNLNLGEKSQSGYSDWSIEYTIQKNVNIANKSSLSSNVGRLIRYNIGSPARFAAYASTTGSTITLYRYVPSVSVSSVGYATYYNEFPYVMPEGLEGKIMEENNTTHVISSALIFNAGDVVPAETALLLKGKESVYPLLYTTAAPDELTAEYCSEYNLLKGTHVDAETTGGSKYYKFANDPDDGLGWYWGADNGAAFTNPAHKAYLAIPEGGNSPRFIAIENETLTAIESVEANANTEIYDLAGRRVKNATNGLYIVNGKKVIR